jgi:hypothetical protein
MITYRVMPVDGSYAVYREGLPKGSHELEGRAIQAAKFMAAVESSRFGAFTEVLLHVPGRIDLVGQFSPADQVGPPLPSVQIGDEVVALR